MIKNKKILYVLGIVPILYIFLYISNIGAFWENKQEQSNSAIQEAITKAALECYALEGSFPPSIEYLEQNYGVIINDNSYIYHYEPNGSNIMPDIQVIKKWNKN